ncbi:MAG: hypothetical protein U0610_28035 [bacterium]
MRPVETRGRVLGRSLVTALASAVWILAGCPPTDVDPCLHQVSSDGFGDAKNRYAWSMKEFASTLYVGTLNTIDASATPDGEPLATAPGDPRDATEGTQIWRFDGTAWTNVVSAGFGDLGNEGARNLEVFRGALYAGTLNVTTGAEVWQSDDGLAWTQVNPDGFGNPANTSVRGMTVWRDRLWVGTVNQQGAEVWSYDGTTWTNAAAGGIGDPTNDTVADLFAFEDRLYAGTWNEGGAQLHRFDGTSWEQLVGPTAALGPGFGDAANTGIFTILDFHGALYVSTRNFVEGFSVWRSADLGATWQRVVANGFSDPRQRYGWRMHVHDGQLYLGTWVSTTGSDAFRVGGRLYRTSDGTSWVQEVGPFGTLAPPGIGDDLNYGIRTFESFQGSLHIGTAQCFFCDFPVTGLEVWRRDSSCPGSSPTG